MNQRRFKHITIASAIGFVSIFVIFLMWKGELSHSTPGESHNMRLTQADTAKNQLSDEPDEPSLILDTTFKSTIDPTFVQVTTQSLSTRSTSTQRAEALTDWSARFIKCSDHLRNHSLKPVEKPSGYQIDGHVTRIVHQSWKSSELPPRYLGWSLTWCEQLPDWRYMLWTDEDNERLVREHYAWFYAKYKSFRQNIYRIDSIRYIYMHRFGGVYTDLDNVCLRNFEHVLAGRGLVWGDMEMWGRRTPHYFYIQNSWMYSRPGHPFWLDLLNNIMELSPNENGRPEGVTGPNRLMHVLNQKWDSYPDMIVYPPDGYHFKKCFLLCCCFSSVHFLDCSLLRFNPFSWGTRRNTPCKDLNNMNDVEMKQCIDHHKARPESFVLQLHTQSWGGGKALKKR